MRTLALTQVVDFLALCFHAAFAQFLARARRVVCSSDAPPQPGDERVSVKWLSNILGTEVTTVSIFPIDESKGLVGQIEKVFPQAADVRFCRPMILKRSADSLAARRSNIACGRYREAFFYNEVASLGGIGDVLKLPQIFFASGSELFGEYTILMEDLSAGDQICVTKVFGNQCWGLDADDPARALDPIATLETLADATACMHAKHWRQDSLLHIHWLRQAPYYHGRGQAAWERGLERGRNLWLASKSAGVKVSNKLGRIIDASFAISSWDRLQAHLNDPETPWTLCQGDFHGGNLMISGSTNELHIFDWSEVSVGEPYDLGQLLVSDVAPSIFREQSIRVMRIYWEALVRKGVKNWSWEACWSSFCRRTIERWLFLFAVIAGIPQIPTMFLSYLDNQLLSFIEAHGDENAYEMKNIIEMP